MKPEDWITSLVSLELCDVVTACERCERDAERIIQDASREKDFAAGIAKLCALVEEALK